MIEIRRDRELEDHVLDGVPAIDVRAPIEFAAGSIPGAHNLPLLDNEQRAAVGLVYKTSGSNAAVALGNELISDRERESKLKLWSDFASAHPRSRIYCFRGGLRSKLVADTLKSIGIDLPVIAGGYKRWRQFSLRALSEISGIESFTVVAGCTGSGKTEFLRTNQDKLRICDLEIAARHRGSSFGSLTTSQPSQADFEHAITVDLLRATRNSGSRPGPIFVEDESRLVGKSVVPQILFQRILEAPLFVIDIPAEERAEYLIRSYLWENHSLRDGDTDAQRISELKDAVISSLKKIEKRMGGAECRALLAMLEEAIAQQLKSGRVMVHFEWVLRLLGVYYDPVYLRHLERERKRIVWRGSREDLERVFLDQRLRTLSPPASSSSI